MSVYTVTNRGITSGEYTITGSEQLSVSSRIQLNDSAAHPPGVKPKINVTPLTTIAGFNAWIKDTEWNGATKMWTFRIEWSAEAKDMAGEKIGYLVQSIWN